MESRPHQPTRPPGQSPTESKLPPNSRPELARRKKNSRFRRDTLTGLHGQKYLCHAIDTCLERARYNNLSATLALLQLENFYEIRSWVGLSEADLLLTDISQLLKASLPKRVLLCRCHNYEFAALLLADCSVNAQLITDKLKQVLLSAVSPSLPPQLELKCGVGLTKLEAQLPSWPVVFARARHNLSLAHQHSQLPSHMNTLSPNVALAQLQSALERTELDLNFQALIRLTEDPLQHYEVRCSLEADESSPPTRFLFETAAENALGEQLDRRILEQLMRRLLTCADPGQRLVVNMSHNSLVSIHFLRWLEERIGNNPDIASKLVFQISETDALIAQHHLIPFCEAINKLGCGLSVSNFGCTPKPMRYLSLVPANLVKLDTTLLHKIEASQTNLTNLVSLIEELHAREIKVVAPMLERLAILPLLWRAGVDFMQGNCLHSPASSMNYPILKTRTINHAKSA